VHSWRVSADRPMSLIGAGRAPVVATGEVISCTEPLEGNAPFFTALVGEQGEVTLLTWRLL
jgi:hypothetical protein